MGARAAALMRIVLLGDGESPHLLKWARALAAQPGVELWAASSRRWLPAFDGVLPASRTLALDTRPRAGGGNAALLRCLPRLARWLRGVDADWIHAHYLTSHGTLAWLARRGWRLRARLAGSAWGSDVLVAPARSRVLRALTARVLGACALTTSDSQTMAQRMRELGARDVMVFPFGLESLPPAPADKDDDLYYANRGLEPLYDPERVLAQFAAVAGDRGRLVVANDGSLRGAVERRARELGFGADRVRFVGRLDADEQGRWYARARWFLSLPRSDSVSVSVIEAMAHGCVPVVSDLPANRELVDDGANGLVVPDGALLPRERLLSLQPRADAIAARNREWVARHALFAPSVAAFVDRLRAIDGAAR